MGKKSCKINKKDLLLRKGNTSLAIGTTFGISSIACPCPFCILGSITFLINGIRQKLEVILWK